MSNVNSERIINIPKIGDVFQNNKGCLAKVVKYESHKKVAVKFLDAFGHIDIFPSHRLKNGKFKNLYFPSVFDVGYVGSGEFKTSLNGIFTEEYKAWCSMMARCYSDSFKKNELSYKECSVHRDWHNFQVFAKWYTSQKQYKLGYQLDKDILVTGNKIYSKDTCCLVPVEINKGVIGSKDVEKDKFGISKRPNGKYQLRYSEFGKRVHVGDFEDIKSARDKYLEMKSKYVRKLGEIYKECIDKEVYERLSKWNIILTGEKSV